MKDVLVPIDRTGRIVLPKNVREELSIRPGDAFKVSIHGAAVMLTPNKQKSGFVRKGRAIVFAAGGGELLDEETARAILEKSREETSAVTAIKPGTRAKT